MRKTYILNNKSNFILKLPETRILSCLCVIWVFAITNQLQAVGGEDEDDEHAPFMRKPFCVYRGHTADLLDLSWSKVRTYQKYIYLLRISRLLNLDFLKVHSFFWNVHYQNNYDIYHLLKDPFFHRITLFYRRVWTRLWDCGMYPEKSVFVAFNILILSLPLPFIPG